MRLWYAIALTVAASLAGTVQAQPSAQSASPRPPDRLMTFGHVEADCALAADRGVGDCVVVRESPSGMGSRLIAQQLGPAYRTPDWLAATAKEGRVRIVFDVPLIPPPPRRMDATGVEAVMRH